MKEIPEDEYLSSDDFISLETLFKNEGTVIVFYQNEFITL